MSIEAMKQALAKFESLWEIGIDAVYRVELLPEIQALRQAIEQAEKQEPEQKPVSTNDHLCAMLRQVHDVLACTALPMKRKWYGLTQEDRDDLLNYATTIPSRIVDRTEAKLKEKNT